MGKNETKKEAPFWRRELLPCLVFFGLFVLIRGFVLDWNCVTSGSMLPTVFEGDRILVNKLAYGLRVPIINWHVLDWGKPERGEIVVFDEPRVGMDMVKRIVGVPGDTVEMRDEQLYINGEPVQSQRDDLKTDEHFASQRDKKTIYATEKLGGHTHPILIVPELTAVRSFSPVTVPAGSYYIMGDNRDISNDSRFLGLIPREKIIGRSSFVIASIDQQESHRARWNRFFTTLP